MLSNIKKTELKFCESSGTNHKNHPVILSKYKFLSAAMQIHLHIEH